MQSKLRDPLGTSDSVYVRQVEPRWSHSKFQQHLVRDYGYHPSKVPVRFQIHVRVNWRWKFLLHCRLQYLRNDHKEDFRWQFYSSAKGKIMSSTLLPNPVGTITITALPEKKLLCNSLLLFLEHNFPLFFCAFDTLSLMVSSNIWLMCSCYQPIRNFSLLSDQDTKKNLSFWTRGISHPPILCTALLLVNLPLVPTILPATLVKWLRMRRVTTITINLRRPWTMAFLQPTPQTADFSLQFKNYSDHVITFLWLCSFKNTNHEMLFLCSSHTRQKKETWSIVSTFLHYRFYYTAS